MFLDQLRWGEASRREQSNNPWEWLVDSIELGRVYATIECFPIHDFLNLGHMDKAKGCTYKGIEHHVYTKVSSSDRNGDQRYSPGFLLPLVLGALEEEADRMNFLSNGSVSHSFVCDSSKVKGVLVAQRLCEKGALALALASLASQCSSLRKLSIAIIGHIAGAVDSQYAHQTASWRERPQIAMLLNAVQRSLVVRYAEAQGSMEESSPIEVPELPGFSAIFLARASLILARPSDPLFLDINRCFLRTEIDGGGFQDLTRLPAFMSLFCSSSDCTDQLACERNFALDLVKDGFTNDDSYKLLMACHCPELLLTSIESARARSLIGVEDELPLLFTTLSKLVSTGGERVASHLINRMGLLSWLRSLLLGNVSFFKMSSRVTFLKLLSVVTRRTVDLIPCDEFTAATAGLPQAVLSLALECVDGPDLVQTLPASMTVCICQMLATFSSVKITEGTDGHSQCNRLLRCQSDGVQLELAIQFISILNSHEQQRSALLSVCLLPAMFYPEDSSLAKAFCIMVLKSSMTMDDCTAEFKLVVLRRVSMLSGVLCHAWLDREPILRKLMAWRRECAHETQSREAWHTCVEALVCDEEKQSKAPLSDASNEAELASWVLRNEKHSSVGFADGSMN